MMINGLQKSLLMKMINNGGKIPINIWNNNYDRFIKEDLVKYKLVNLSLNYASISNANIIKIHNKIFAINKINYGYSLEDLDKTSSSSSTEFKIYAENKNELKNKLLWYINGDIPMTWNKEYKGYNIYIEAKTGGWTGSVLSLNVYNNDINIFNETLIRSKSTFLQLERNAILKIENHIKYKI